MFAQINNGGAIWTPTGAGLVAVPAETLRWNFMDQTLQDDSATYTLALTRATANTASYHDASGYINFAAVNSPRWDHDPVSLEFKGLLQEESRQSTASFPEDLNGSGWTKSNTTITVNATTSPKNDSTMDRINETTLSASSFSVAKAFSTTINVKHAISCFYKDYDNGTEIRTKINCYTGSLFSQWRFTPRTGELTLTGGTATVDDYGVIAYPNGIYRIWMVQNANATGAGSWDNFLVHDDWATVHDGVSTAGMYMWGLQSEPGDYPTSYMGGTTARQADALSLTPISAWWDEANASFMTELDKGLSGGANWNTLDSSRCVAVSDNSANNYWLLNRDYLADQTQAVAFDSAVQEFNVLTSDSLQVGVERFAFSFDSSPEVDSAHHGKNGGPETSGTIPKSSGSLTHMYPGGGPTGAVNGVQYIRELRYWDSKLTAEELRSVTDPSAPY